MSDLLVYFAGIISSIIVLTVALVVLVPTSKQVFIETYKYILPAGIGDAESAYKCKQAGGKYIFAQGGAVCLFN